MWIRLAGSNWSCSSMWSRLRPRCFNHSLDLSPIGFNPHFHRTDVKIQHSLCPRPPSQQRRKICTRHKLAQASPPWAFPRLDFGLISWTNLRIHGLAAATNMDPANHSPASVPQFNDHHHLAGLTLEKSQTDATNVNIPLIGQAVWGHTLKHTISQWRDNADYAMHVYKQNWRYTKGRVLKAIYPIQVELLKLGLARQPRFHPRAVRNPRLVLAPKKWNPHAIFTFGIHSPTKRFLCIFHLKIFTHKSWNPKTKTSHEYDKDGKAHSKGNAGWPHMYCVAPFWLLLNSKQKEMPLRMLSICWLCAISYISVYKFNIVCDGVCWASTAGVFTTMQWCGCF